MKKSEIAKIENLGKDLAGKAKSFTHTARMEWAIKNNMSLYTVNRYMKGEIGSTIIAKKLLDDIQQYEKQVA